MALVSGFWHTVPKTQNFLSDKGDRSIFCSRDMTFGGLLGSFKRVVVPEKPALIRSLEHSTHLPLISRAGKGAGE